MITPWNYCPKIIALAPISNRDIWENPLGHHNFSTFFTVAGSGIIQFTERFRLGVKDRTFDVQVICFLLKLSIRKISFSKLVENRLPSGGAETAAGVRKNKTYKIWCNFLLLTYLKQFNRSNLRLVQVYFDMISLRVYLAAIFLLYPLPKVSSHPMESTWGR